MPRVADADTFVRVAAVAALSSPDLTAKDRTRVAKAIRVRFQEYKAALGLDTEAAPGETSFGEPKSAAEVARAMAHPPTMAQVAASARHFDPTPVTAGELFGD
jgi:hypothetical protein